MSIRSLVLSICLSINPSTYLSIDVSVCQSVYLSICLSTLYLYVYVFVYVYSYIHVRMHILGSLEAGYSKAFLRAPELLGSRARKLSAEDPTRPSAMPPGGRRGAQCHSLGRRWLCFRGEEYTKRKRHRENTAELCQNPITTPIKPC